MGLVHHEQPHSCGLESLDEPRRGEPLGGHVEQAHRPGRRAGENTRVGLRVLLGVDERNAVPETARAQGLDLVLHERHQRRDHHREVVAHQRGELVAERLAGARGHDHQHVAPADRGFARLALAPAK